MIVSVTELHLHSIWKLFRAIKLSAASIQEAQATEGNKGVKTKIRGVKLYTLTHWDTLDSMKTFVRGAAHGSAMRETTKLAKSTTVKHWETDQLVSWKDALHQLRHAN